MFVGCNYWQVYFMEHGVITEYEIKIYAHTHWFTSLRYSQLPGLISINVGRLVGGISKSKQHGYRESAVAPGHIVPQLSHEPLSVRSLHKARFPSRSQLPLRQSGHSNLLWKFQKKLLFSVVNKILNYEQDFLYPQLCSLIPSG